MTSRPARPTQRERRARTETLLLDAALRLIARSGSRGTSVAEVASEAGYSRGIVTHQFGGKEGLLRAAVHHAQQRVGEPPPGARGLAWLLAFVDRYLAVSDPGRDATRAFLVMWSEAAAGEPVLRELFRERDEWFRGLVVDAVTAGVADGSVRGDVDPRGYAYLLVGQLRGTGLQLILSEDAAARPAIRAECLDMVRRHLAAGAPDARAP